MSAAPTVVYQVNHQLVGEAENAVSEFPPEARDWLGTVAVNDDWKPVYRGALSQKWLYKKDNKEVVLYVGYYPAQKQGEELINDLNRISNKEVWRTLYPRPRLQSAGNQQVLEQMIDSSSTRKQRLVWYWYNIAGKVTTNKYEAKVLQLLGLLTGKPEAFVVAAAVQTGNNAEFGRQVLKDFILSVEKSMKYEMERLAGR